MSLTIPEFAKEEARKALLDRARLPASKKFGLDKEEAKELSINSGVERAKQIIRNKTLPKEDVKRVASFYNRFKNCRTDKCEGAIDLWGGRRFGRLAQRYINSSD